MLCAVCLSMFSRDAAKGTHHTCLHNLQRAAEGGCKICIALALRRSKFGPDLEAEETASPFLEYQWRRERTIRRSKNRFYFWQICFDSEISWLQWNNHLWNRVDIHTSKLDEPVPSWYLDVSKHAANDLDSRPWMVRRELFPLRPIPDSTGHNPVLDIAKTWLQNCETHHDCETLKALSTLDSEWYPKRLIDITDVALPRLLETNSERPCQPFRYATLSHCWGSNPDFITLTTENSETFCKGIPIDTLPKSFHDAIIVCNHLGIRYIWIDSLCILQDSHPDWLLHATEMSSVYQNCHLNLSLDAAANPNQGAFAYRNPDVLQDCCSFSTFLWDLGPTRVDDDDSSSSESDFSSNVSDDTSGSLRSGEAKGISSPGETGSPEGHTSTATKDVLKCLVFVPDLDYSLANPDLPLSTRGWVVQERLLSPRVLHFTDDRIRWECDKEDALHEGLPHGLPGTGEPFDQYAKHEFNCFPDMFPERSKWDHFDHWEGIVRIYSQCQLTYPEKDKLVALSAVAQRFSRVFSNEYYAGHFRENMPFDLGWQVLRRGYEQEHSTRRYPTWSWTSVDSEVSALSVWCQLRHPLATVEEVSVYLEDPTYKYGPVNGGKLVLRGLVIRCKLEPSSHKGYMDEIKTIHLEQAMGCDSCSVQTCLAVTMDTPGEATFSDAFLLPLAERTVVTRKHPRAVMGIMLLQQTDGLYRRVGYWDSDPDNVLNLDNGPLFDYIDRYSHHSHRVVVV